VAEVQVCSFRNIALTAPHSLLDGSIIAHSGVELAFGAYLLLDWSRRHSLTGL
jgi:hypothetical protein